MNVSLQLLTLLQEQAALSLVDSMNQKLESLNSPTRFLLGTFRVNDEGAIGYVIEEQIL